MNGQHTQGQWSWYEHGKTDTSPVKVETKDQVIAEVVYKTDHEERIANARLIAAAPELLDAAKAVLQIWDDLYLRAAIAKAEGKAQWRDEMSKQGYQIIVGETGNEVGHVTSSSHVSDAAAVRKAKRLCAAYRGDGWWRVECAGETVARGGRGNY